MGKLQSLVSAILFIEIDKIISLVTPSIYKICDDSYLSLVKDNRKKKINKTKNRLNMTNIIHY